MFYFKSMAPRGTSVLMLSCRNNNNAQFLEPEWLFEILDV